MSNPKIKKGAAQCLNRLFLEDSKDRLSIEDGSVNHDIRKHWRCTDHFEYGTVQAGVWAIGLEIFDIFCWLPYCS